MQVSLNPCQRNNYFPQQPFFDAFFSRFLTITNHPINQPFRQILSNINSQSSSSFITNQIPSFYKLNLHLVTNILIYLHQLESMWHVRFMALFDSIRYVLHQEICSALTNCHKHLANSRSCESAGLHILQILLPAQCINGLTITRPFSEVCKK